MKNLLARDLDLDKLLKKKSFFLFGPRSTGKSTLNKQQLKHAIRINLLDSAYLLRLNRNPEDLQALIEASGPVAEASLIVIDEIQKVPALLNEVHRLIEDKNWKFLLTGSSARRLKASGVNLLAGRAWIAQLFPFTSHELGELFDLDKAMLHGTLPQVYLSSEPVEELNAYITTYINEEIKQEGFVRKIPSFLSFLKLAALTNGQLLNFASIANDIGIAASTVREYYKILEDTLVGSLLESWQDSKKRKAISTAKFFFFDTGIAHRLQDVRGLERNSDLYGNAFEHWVWTELRAYLSYTRSLDSLRYWRSTSQLEVDFLIGQSVAIEVKATRKVQRSDLKGLRALNEEGIFKRFYLISHDPLDMQRDGVFCLNWQTFCRKLWSGGLL